VRYRSIQSRLLFVVLLSSGLVLLITGAAFIIYEWVMLRESLLRRFSVLAQMTAANSTAALAFRNEEDAREVLSALAVDPRILTGALYDNQGRLFATYLDGRAAAELPARPDNGHAYTGTSLVVSVPVSENGTVLGTLVLQTSLSAFYESIRTLALIVGVVFVVALVASVTLSTRLHKNITRPILALAKVAHAISVRKDYSVRAPPGEANEIGELMLAFNQMLAQIQTQNSELRESEERYRLLVEQSPEVISVVVDKRIEFINPAGMKLYGAQQPEDLIGRSPMDLVHPDSLPFLEERNRRLQEGKRNPPAELKIRTLDGRIVYVESTAIPFTYLGRPAWQGVARDVTARKQAEDSLREINENLERMVAERTAELQEAKERAEKSDNAKTAFLATMSHELRTPLNAIMGFTGTLLMRLPGPLNEVQEKQLRTVQSSARHLLSLINDLLDLAKIESGKVELQLTDIHCQAVVNEVEAAMRPAAEGRGLKLEVRVPPEPVTVRADKRALSQILLNLVSNAVKFTEQGSVRITVARRSNDSTPEVEFVVADTGVGIAPEDQAKLFSAFAQVGRGSRPRPEGTGLGLHLSKKLAALLGGYITFDSVPGRGSAFTLILASGQTPSSA
jgi:PAS domain S-box-containing protein